LLNYLLIDIFVLALQCCDASGEECHCAELIDFGGRVDTVFGRCVAIGICEKVRIALINFRSAAKLSLPVTIDILHLNPCRSRLTALAINHQ
jgi:hypothetical protein